MELTRRRLLTAAAALPLAAAVPAEAARAPSTLTWAGRTWWIRSGTGDPGPCTWDPYGPVVDPGDSRLLHLRIRPSGSGWGCSEVFTSGLGFGTYEWTFTLPPGGLDKNVTLGLFTYESGTRETDIEVAQWGGVDGHTAQWAVQPASTAGNVSRFDLPPGATVTARYTWRAGSASFSGTSTAPGGVATELPPWTNSRVTTSNRGRPHMNLWLFNGSAPSNTAPVDVVVSRFAFTPLS